MNNCGMHSALNKGQEEKIQGGANDFNSHGLMVELLTDIGYCGERESSVPPQFTALGEGQDQMEIPYLSLVSQSQLPRR
jgi:hypothetical protein